MSGLNSCRRIAEAIFTTSAAPIGTMRVSGFGRVSVGPLKKNYWKGKGPTDETRPPLPTDCTGYVQFACGSISDDDWEYQSEECELLEGRG